ncbi:porin [Pseudobdellovibrio sp. HCB154]|uniref:porin n=1 Tax=Pseudobdellovibrio sp. HCB154 TaxID=3386277 RepID=UPI0039172797
MKQLVTLTFLGLAFALPASAKPEKHCAVAYVAGDSCKNLRVDFNLKNCGVTTTKKPKISCNGSSATATIEADKWVFKTKLKHYVGQNTSIWDVNGDVQFSEKSEPAPRKVATESPAPVSVSATTAAASAPQTLAATPAAAPAPVSAPAQVVEVKSDFVPTWKNNALIQFWYVEDQTQYATAADKNFRVRRAELKLTGSSAENTRWFLVADFAKSLATTTTSVVTSSPSTKTNVTGINTDGDSKILQDMGIALKLAPDLELTLGQFKLPTTAESMQATTETLFAEKALLSRTYGERRDPGAMLSYKYDKIKASVAVSNGQGPNVDEKNDRKDYTGRLEATLPWGFNVGTFALCKEAICYDLNRYGVNLGWTYSDLSLRAEYVNSNISSVRATTYMVDAGYKLSDKWQVATRYESLQPNVSSSFKSSAATVGVNYFLSKQNLKFQLNHTQLFNMRGNNGSYSSSADQKGSLIIFAIQNNF